MALSRIYAVICMFLFTLLCAADRPIKEYTFDIEWVIANPDGLHTRPVISINGSWPIPTIYVTKGDRLIVNVNNKLGNQSTTLHFHGLFQNGTAEMDGVGTAVQCGIPPGSSLKYDMNIDQSGTYWYHSHITGQYPDGLRGPLIVHDPENPYQNMFDEEYVLTISDWYHEQMPILLKQFISVTNPTGAEPVPNSDIMNDQPITKFKMTPGKTYFFRMINYGAFAGQYFWFEDHEMRIIEVDGVYVEPQPTNMIYITAAQRYGVLVTAKGNTDRNYAIVGSMDTSLFDVTPPTLNYNVTGWLEYNSNKEFAPAKTVDKFDPYDDINLIPHDHLELFENPTQRIEMTIHMGDLGNGANYAFINDRTYVAPKVPSLYTVLSTGEMATDPRVYSLHSNPFILRHNEVIEIVLNNDDTGKHPFHLHGHNFQAVYRSPPNAGYYATPANATDGDMNLPRYPMRRDTFMIYPQGNYVIRFRSDNPGIWLFHCHIEWHVDTGLVTTIVEAPLETQKITTVPDDFYKICEEQGQPTRGNAAGNTKDLLDLTGQNVPPAPLPGGFTAKGIVALVFSAIAAVIGMIVIGWYGMRPISESEGGLAAKKRIAELTGVRTNEVS